MMMMMVVVVIHVHDRQIVKKTSARRKDRLLEIFNIKQSSHCLICCRNHFVECSDILSVITIIAQFTAA